MSKRSNSLLSAAEREGVVELRGDLDALPLPNRHAALECLRDKRLLRELAYIDGKWPASHAATRFPVTDPATGALLAEVASLDAAQTGEAIAAAARAFAA